MKGMASPTSTQSDSTDTRQRILEVSVEFFRTKGFRATSLAEIAAAVGIQKASLYYHMPNKAMLLEAVFEEVTPTLTAVPDWESTANITALQKLSMLIANHTRFHIANQDFMRIFWRERHELPATAYKKIREREIRYERYVEGLIKQGQEEGEFDSSVDPSLARLSILGMLTTVYRWPHPKDASTEYVSNVISHVSRLLICGLGTTQAREVAFPTELEKS